MSRNINRTFAILILVSGLVTVGSLPLPAQTDRPSAPNPAIAKTEGRMLKVGSLSELKGDKTCNDTGGILVYAETESYRIYICADRKDKTQARYYRSRERNGKGKLDIEAKGYNPNHMRYFQFKNNGYSYLVQKPMSQIPQPELTVLSPEEQTLLRERVTRYLARP
jgi:hypothetical protein